MIESVLKCIEWLSYTANPSCQSNIQAFDGTLIYFRQDMLPEVSVSTPKAIKQPRNARPRYFWEPPGPVWKMARFWKQSVEPTDHPPLFPHFCELNAVPFFVGQGSWAPGGMENASRIAGDIGNIRGLTAKHRWFGDTLDGSCGYPLVN